MSRGQYRPIHTVLADSPEFQVLSKDARLLLYTFKMSMGPSGIDVLYADQLCERSGLTRREFTDALDELVEHDWIIWQRQVFWLRNGLEFEPNLSHKNEKHRKGVQTHVEGLPKLSIVNEFARYYGEWFPDGVPFPELEENKGSRKGIERVSEGPRNTETETETNTETTGLSRLVGVIPDSAGAREVVGAVARSAKGSLDTWALGFVGMYGPNGTRAGELGQVPEDDRPTVLLDALQAYLAEGQPWDQRFFSGFLRNAVKRHLGGEGPDFGDETARDAERAASYRQRETERKREEWEAEEAEADAEMAELWSWWEDVDAATRQVIESEAREKCEQVPEPMHRAILVGVIQEHREGEAANA